MELQEQDSKHLRRSFPFSNAIRNRKIRASQGADTIPPRSGDLSSKRKVFRDRQEIQLTTKEYEILLLLVTHKGYVLTYNQIYEKVWGNLPVW